MTPEQVLNYNVLRYEMSSCSDTTEYEHLRKLVFKFDNNRKLLYDSLNGLTGIQLKNIGLIRKMNAFPDNKLNIDSVVFQTGKFFAVIYKFVWIMNRPITEYRSNYDRIMG